MSDISAALPGAPLCLIDAEKRIWFLNAALVVSDGAKLVLHGAKPEGREGVLAGPPTPLRPFKKVDLRSWFSNLF